jgi:hypothetical protein
MTDLFSQRIEWLGIALRVPEDWQIIRHGLSPKKGRLSFVDRRRQRMELVWTRCDREPDLERMIDNQKSRELELDRQTEFQLRRGPKDWIALSCRGAGPTVVTRAVRFHRPSLRLIEANVLTQKDEPNAQELVWGLLGGIEVAGRAEQARHWSAFDINVTVPPGYRLIKTRVLPLDVTLRFGSGDAPAGSARGPEVSVRRMGMAGAWYSGDPESLIRRDLDKVRFAGFQAAQLRGHPVTRAEGEERVAPFFRLLGRRRKVRILLWECEPENALYQVTALAPLKNPVSPDDFQVDCGPPGDRQTPPRSDGSGHA